MRDQKLGHAIQDLSGPWPQLRPIRIHWCDLLRLGDRGPRHCYFGQGLGR